MTYSNLQISDFPNQGVFPNQTDSGPKAWNTAPTINPCSPNSVRGANHIQNLQVCSSRFAQTQYQTGQCFFWTPKMNRSTSSASQNGSLTKHDLLLVASLRPKVDPSPYVHSPRHVQFMAGKAGVITGMRCCLGSHTTSASSLTHAPEWLMF